MEPVPFDCTRLRARLETNLSLQDIRPVAPGLARARQLLRIGDDIVTSDDVLIEEARYPIVDEMNAELNSMPIKMGMYSPFVKTSTYPPKYYFVERTTAWLCTSVPPVSLAVVLERLTRDFPPHYTWDRPAYVRDMFNACVAASRLLWQHRAHPMFALKETLQLLRQRMPRRIRPRERLQLAALLVDAVRPRHQAGIYHNTITADTVFFTDGVSPRVLCNYAGIVSPAVEWLLPDALLHVSKNDSFGEQSVDTYCLALLASQIITGRHFNGTRFILDDPRELLLPAWLQYRPGHAVAAMGMDIACECYLGASRLLDRIRATTDNTRFQHFRTLTRASGSLIRSLPGIRYLLDIWFPSETALVLRSILDKTSNDALFGPRTGINRHAKTKYNANLAYLRAVLPTEPLSPRSRLARYIQGIIEEHMERLECAVEEDVAPLRVRLSFKRPWLLRYAVAVVLCTGLCAGTANHASGVPSVRPAITPPDKAPEVTGCRARLLPNRRLPGVFKLVDLRARCNTSDITFAAADDTEETTPPSLGETYVTLYLVPHEKNTATDIIAIRPCPSPARGCEPGEFYRATGVFGLAERIRLENGALMAFDRRRLEHALQSTALRKETAPTSGNAGADR